MRVLITGAAGFVGSHLIEYAVRKGHADFQFGKEPVEVFAADRWNVRKDNLEDLGPGYSGLYRFLEFDLTDYQSVRGLVREVMPDVIFHLAAQSFVPTSWRAPAETFAANVGGELNLFEAVRDSGCWPAIHIAGSSEEYGMVMPDEVPITEANPLRPLSPYGVSKVAQDLLGYQYHASYGMKIVRTRAFNHTGPRRGEQFATSAFAKQIAEIEVGLREPKVLVGNLEAVRDFTDVRDIVRGYWAAVEKGKPGEVYNLATGKGWAMSQVLDLLLSYSTASGIEVVKDPERMRPSDVPVLIGDAGKFRADTGWLPAIPFAKTMKDLLDHWRGRVAAR